MAYLLRSEILEDLEIDYGVSLIEPEKIADIDLRNILAAFRELEDLAVYGMDILTAPHMPAVPLASGDDAEEEC